jgi:hypothetical protein
MQQKENGAMKHFFLIPLFILFFLLASCNFSPNSGRGFALPEGNADKGRTTFVELECNACHSVGDIKHAAAREGPDINIALGGQVTTLKTYGDLVTSVINPAYKTNRRFINRGIDTAGAELEMAVYNDKMTVQQLVDLVTYLETNYEFVPPTRTEYAVYDIKGG